MQLSIILKMSAGNNYYVCLLDNELSLGVGDDGLAPFHRIPDPLYVILTFLR